MELCLTCCCCNLPRWAFSGGLAALVEYTRAWPPSKHGASRAFSPGEAQINVGLQEPGVGVLFHQAVHFHLGDFKTAFRGLCYVLLDGHLGAVVDVHLCQRRKDIRMMQNPAEVPLIAHWCPDAQDRNYCNFQLRQFSSSPFFSLMP